MCRVCVWVFRVVRSRSGSEAAGEGSVCVQKVGGELSEVVAENGEGVNDDTKLAHINHSLEDLIRSILGMNCGSLTSRFLLPQQSVVN